MTYQNSTKTNCTVNVDYLTPLFVTFLGSSIASVVGNFLVILIVVRNSKLRTTPNYFIASMSVSDMFFPTAYLIVTVTVARYDGHLRILSNQQTNILHALAKFFIDVSFGVSTQTLMAICVHRFYAVVYPLKARLENLKICTLTICFNWISSTALFVPELYYSIKKSHEAFDYGRRRFTERIVLDVVNTGLVVVPFLVMLVLYSLIIVRLRGRKLPGMTNSSSQHTARRKKQNKRLSLMFITIVFIFFFSWGFLWSLVLIHRYVFLGRNCLVQEIITIAQISPAIYTAINPLIYFVYSTNFRQGLKNICACCTLSSVRKTKQNNSKT